MAGLSDRLKGFMYSLKMREKISLFITMFLFVVFLIFGIVIFNYEKNKTLNTVDQIIFDKLNTIEYLTKDLNISKNGEIYNLTSLLNQQLLSLEITNDYNENKEKIIERILEQVESEVADITNTASKKLVEEIKFLESGFAFIVSRNGKLLTHPTDEGTDISDRLYFHIMSTSGKNTGKFEYVWPESQMGKEKVLFYKYDRALNVYYAYSVFKSDVNTTFTGFRNRLIYALLILLAINFVFTYFVSKPLLSGINRLVTQINDIALGKKYTHEEVKSKDEVGEIFEAVNNLSKGLGRASQFAQEMGEGNLDASFESLGEEDALGNALVEMRKSLKKNQEEEKHRRIEDEKRSWSAQGVAKINDILRNYNNLTELGDNIVNSLVELLEANQGGLFVYDDEDKETPKLKLLAAFAYGRKKYLKKEVLLGEGLVGSCAKEKKKIYLRDIPEDYIEITSGLGKATPRELIIVPLIFDEKILGAIELASFNQFEEHYIEFLERIAETIASTLANAKINSTTSHLLEQSRLQSEELASREEELRQNMEEMSATQEESQRREKDLQKEVELLKAEINRLRSDDKSND